MALIKCENCGKEISSNAKVCIHCGNFKKNQKETYGTSSISIERNINYLLKLSKFVKIGAFICIGLLLLIGLVTIIYRRKNLFVFCLIISVGIAIVALFGAPVLEWKAYILKNLYEINKK